jgi:hypothetical protein
VSAHVPGGTLQDGYDAHYGDDPSKGLRAGRGQLGGFGGGQGPGKGLSLGTSGAGGLSGGGGSFAGEGGPGASGPSGILYGSGAMDVLLGGSGGGYGNLGEAAAGGGVLEIESNGSLIIEPGVLIAMNGGTVFVNPYQGAYYSGGAGSGGAIRLVGQSISNRGIIEASGGDSSGASALEPGTRFLSNAGGAGGGGRVSFISDGTIDLGQVNVNGGTGNGDGFSGFSGSIYQGVKTLSAAVNLDLSEGTLIFDTGGTWSHTSGIKGGGQVQYHYYDILGKRFGYGVSTFTFASLSLGENVSVLVKGSNALEIVVEGNASIRTSFSLDGKSGISGVYSGLPGPGGWSSGRGLRYTDMFSNIHPSLNGQGPGGGRGYEMGNSNGGGSYGGLGSGGLNSGVAGITYGDDKITQLIGGSGGGHALSGSGNAGGGGGALSFLVSGSFTLDANATLSVRGGHGQFGSDGSGAGGSGGAIRIEAASITNNGIIDARGGDALGSSTLAGAGGGGRVALLSPGSIVEGNVLKDGGQNKSFSHVNYRQQDLVGHWTLDDNQSSNVAINETGDVNLNGVISGNPLRVPGRKGNAFYFDGIDDKIVVSNSAVLQLDRYSVSFWIYPERNDESYTGLFGRNGRNYAIWLGDSNHLTRPFLHHRFGEGDNPNEGVSNFNLSGWNRWYHIVCSNGGISEEARTYVNGSFISTNQRYERKILDNLIKNQTAPLNIGVDPANESSQNQHYLGKMDDIRLYDVPFGSEDVYHLYKGDPGLIDYTPFLPETLQAESGTLQKIISPTLPLITPPASTAISYGTSIDGLDLGQVPGMNYSITGLPAGLSNRIPFSPAEVPGIIAWYDADNNSSFSYYENLAFERNDSIALTDQLAIYSFNETNESVTFDETGNGSHGIFVNDVTRISGKFNGAVRFDGSRDAIVIPKVQHLDSASTFSVSLWFKRFSDIQSNPTAHSISNILFAQASADSNDNLEIGTTGTDIKIYLDNGVDHTFTTNDANLSNNSWHHLSVTYGDELSIYVDGLPAHKSGWTTSHLTGDGDSRVSSTHTYTHAININGSTKTVNGVPFTGSNMTSGSGWSITGFDGTHNSTPSTVTGQIGDILSNGFRYAGDPQKIKLTGLTPGENYTFSLYSQAWGSERNCSLSSSALSQTIMVNQDQFSSSAQDGLLVECSYCAPGTEVEFTIDPVVGSTTWHLYAFSNREGISGFPLSTSSFLVNGPLASSLDSPLSLGLSRPYSDQTGDFNGSIDDLRIFSRELNATEVASLYGSGNGDRNATRRTNIDAGRINKWNDSSGSNKHALADSIIYSPRTVLDTRTGRVLVSFRYGESLKIASSVSMPMSVVMVGKEDGIALPNREFFTKNGWRLSNSGNWGLSRWDDNNPNILSSNPSNVFSIVHWTMDRNGYELRVNGTLIDVSTSGNWHPNIPFDRINEDSSLLIGDLLFLPRTFQEDERTKVEGYFAHKWGLPTYCHNLISIKRVRLQVNNLLFCLEFPRWQVVLW